MNADPPRCDQCPTVACWSIQNLEGDDLQPITRWFACGSHLNLVLLEAPWATDTVHLARLQPEIDL